MNAKTKLHNHLRKHAPHAVDKARKLFSFKHHKLFLLFLFILISYYLFTHSEILSLIGKLNNFSYLGVFIAGVFLVFGFSTPFSVGFLLTSHPNNLLLAAIIGGVGATIGDLFIFKLIKFSFMDEFKKLEKTKLIEKIEKIIKENKSILVKHYLLYVFVGIMIATPLPDEIGISMLAGLTTIKASRLAIISFILHTIVIFLILYLGIII